VNPPPPSRAIKAALIGEGPTEAHLIPVLERLALAQGAREISIEWTGPLFERLEPGHDVSSKLSALLEREHFDLIFVHRDTDQAGYEEREQEIEAARVESKCPSLVVAVIPKRETEAWALVDVAAIYAVVGARGHCGDLKVPRPAALEDCRDPKATLREALRSARHLSQPRGRRGRRHTTLSHRDFSDYRRQLLERIDINGDIGTLRSWQQLATKLGEAVHLAARPETPN